MTHKRPWHLWLVGTMAILWNAIGAVDYLMTHTKNATYMENFNAAQLEYFYNLPSWFVAVWAIAIWSAVLASILLLLGRKLSAQLFLVSLIALIVTDIYSFGLSEGYEIIGGTPASLAFPAAIAVIAIALYCYANNMSHKGVIK